MWKSDHGLRHACCLQIFISQTSLNAMHAHESIATAALAFRSPVCCPSTVVVERNKEVRNSKAIRGANVIEFVVPKGHRCEWFVWKVSAHCRLRIHGHAIHVSIHRH